MIGILQLTLPLSVCVCFLDARFLLVLNTALLQFFSEGILLSALRSVLSRIIPIGDIRILFALPRALRTIWQGATSLSMLSLPRSPRRKSSTYVAVTPICVTVLSVALGMHMLDFLKMRCVLCVLCVLQRSYLFPSKRARVKQLSRYALILHVFLVSGCVMNFLRCFVLPVRVLRSA